MASRMLRGALAALSVLSASPAIAGGPLSVCLNAPVAYNPPTVALNYDLGANGSRTKAQMDAIVTNAVALWTNVPTATISITRGTDLAVDVNSTNYTTLLNNNSDGINPVIYDSDGSIIDAIFGAGSSNSTLGFAGSAFFTAPTCRFAEGRAVINGKISISDTTMGVTIAHEIGHLIGMDHSQLDTTQGLASGTFPLMYPIANRNSLTLHEDDQAAVSGIYPDATLNSVYGQITGTFVLADGTTPVRGANLWARETTTNRLYSVVSDYLLQNTGFFKLLLPAGNYEMRAEAIQTNFTGGSSVGPYSETSADPSFQPPLYPTPGVAMSTVVLGGGTPTVFRINAGCAATLTFRINGTGTVGGNCAALGNQTLTVTKAGGGSGTVTSTPVGIDCGSTCSALFAPNSVVTLTAAAAGGSTFTGWSGSAACSGTGTCAVTMSAAQNVTANFVLGNPANTPRLANISTRMQVLLNNDVLIGGFIISGPTSKTVVVRARGPSLTAAGVPGALADPVLQLFSGQTVIAANDDWTGASNAATIQSSGFAPASTLESAIYTTLSPGAYTAIVTGFQNTTGVGIIEVFEVDQPATPLINISTRGQVLTGNNVMIGGFIIQGTGPQTVVVRARGPSLAAAGIANFLANPMLQLFSGSTQIAMNDNWQTDPGAAVLLSSGFAPADPLEAAIRITLNPGAYTVIVTGAGGGTGVGIVEVFAQ